MSGMDEVTTTTRGALPYLYFENVAGAIDWLTKVFGASERFRIAGPNGVVFHAELELEGSCRDARSPGTGKF